MYTMVDVKQYRENSDGTDLVVSVPGMKLVVCSRERRSRMQRSALMMGGISLRSRGRKHMPTIRDIADWTGYPPEEMKERMKYEHMIRTGDPYFKAFLTVRWIPRGSLSIRSWNLL